MSLVYAPIPLPFSTAPFQMRVLRTTHRWFANPLISAKRDRFGAWQDRTTHKSSPTVSRAESANWVSGGRSSSPSAKQVIVHTVPLYLFLEILDGCVAIDQQVFDISHLREIFEVLLAQGTTEGGVMSTTPRSELRYLARTRPRFCAPGAYGRR